MEDPDQEYSYMSPFYQNMQDISKSSDEWLASDLTAATNVIRFGHGAPPLEQEKQPGLSPGLVPMDEDVLLDFPTNANSDSLLLPPGNGTEFIDNTASNYWNETGEDTASVSPDDDLEAKGLVDTWLVGQLGAGTPSTVNLSEAAEFSENDTRPLKMEIVGRLERPTIFHQLPEHDPCELSCAPVDPGIVPQKVTSGCLSEAPSSVKPVLQQIAIPDDRELRCLEDDNLPPGTALPLSDSPTTPDEVNESGYSRRSSLAERVPVSEMAAGKNPVFDAFAEDDSPMQQFPQPPPPPPAAAAEPCDDAVEAGPPSPRRSASSNDPQAAKGDSTTAQQECQWQSTPAMSSQHQQPPIASPLLQGQDEMVRLPLLPELYSLLSRQSLPLPASVAGLGSPSGTFSVSPAEKDQQGASWHAYDVPVTQPPPDSGASLKYFSGDGEFKVQANAPQLRGRLAVSKADNVAGPAGIDHLQDLQALQRQPQIQQQQGQVGVPNAAALLSGSNPWQLLGSACQLAPQELLTQAPCLLEEAGDMTALLQKQQELQMQQQQLQVLIFLKQVARQQSVANVQPSAVALPPGSPSDATTNAPTSEVPLPLHLNYIEDANQSTRRSTQDTNNALDAPPRYQKPDNITYVTTHESSADAADPKGHPCEMDGVSGNESKDVTPSPWSQALKKEPEFSYGGHASHIVLTPTRTNQMQHEESASPTSIQGLEQSAQAAAWATKKNPMQRSRTVKKIKPPRMVLEVNTKEGGSTEDEYRWRKYGDKPVKNSPYKRSYYRCTEHNCRMLKRMERHRFNPDLLLITYVGRHCHPVIVPSSSRATPSTGTCHVSQRHSSALDSVDGHKASCNCKCGGGQPAGDAKADKAQAASAHKAGGPHLPVGSVSSTAPGQSCQKLLHEEPSSKCFTPKRKHQVDLPKLKLPKDEDMEQEKEGPALNKRTSNHLGQPQLPHGVKSPRKGFAGGPPNTPDCSPVSTLSSGHSRLCQINCRSRDEWGGSGLLGDLVLPYVNMSLFSPSAAAAYDKQTPADNLL